MDEKSISCRSCNEFNKYAEPDNVIDDNKYTCWACKTHPYRKYKGLKTKEDIQKFKKYYFPGEEC